MNNSGQGPVNGLPAGVKGWCWGGFLLGPIWAIGNRTWLGLLAFVPYIGLVMLIVLGIKGRQWAWQNKRWDSPEHFNRVQKLWTLWGIGITAVFLAAGLYLYTVYLPAILNGGY